MRARALLGTLLLVMLAAWLAPATVAAHPAQLASSLPPDPIALQMPVTPVPDSPASARQAVPDAAPGATRVPGGGWLVLAALGAAAAWRLGGRRTVVLATLAAILVLAHEGAVHAVHHLGDEPGAASCVVASAASTVTALAADGPGWTAPPAPVSTASAEGVVTASPLPPRGPFQGRAPPRPS